MARQFQGSRWNNRKVVRKNCTLHYEVSDRSAKSIGHAEGLLRIPPNTIKATENNLPSTSPPNENPNLATAINNYQEVIDKDLTPKTVLLTAFHLILKCLWGLPDNLNVNSLWNISPILTIPKLYYGPSG